MRGNKLDDKAVLAALGGLVVKSERRVDNVEKVDGRVTGLGHALVTAERAVALQQEIPGHHQSQKKKKKKKKTGRGRGRKKGTEEPASQREKERKREREKERKREIEKMNKRCEKR